MKEIVIVSCYPNTEYKERLLNECISKLKSLNKEVLIATHYPVPDYIVKKAEYYIYDSNNIDFKHRTLDNSKNCFVEETSTFRLEFLEKCHSPSLSRVSLIGPERIIASLSSSILLEAEKVIVPEAARPFTLVYLPNTVLVVTSSE